MCPTAPTAPTTPASTASPASTPARAADDNTEAWNSWDADVWGKTVTSGLGGAAALDFYEADLTSAAVVAGELAHKET